MQTAMENSFLDLARQGKNEWWRYGVSAALILFLWLAGSFMLALFLIANSLLVNGSRPSFDPDTGQMTGVSPLLLVTVLLLSFLPLLAGLLLAVRFIHARPVSSLITPLARIDWKRIGTGFLAFGVLLGLGCAIEALLYPGRYRFTFDPFETLKFLPVVLILVPFQAAAEELLFRGYIMQGLGLLTRRAWIPVVISSLVFALLHISNPEAHADTLLALASYLAVSLLFALVTIKDNRLELAIGMHIANNVFVLLVNNAVSALPVPPVFTVTTLDVYYSLISTVVIGAIFYAGLSQLGRAQGPGRVEIL